MKLKLYFSRFIGPINPEQPIQSFKILVVFLKVLGLWSPENQKETIQILYKIYSFFMRIAFFHIFLICEILYFKDVTNLDVCICTSTLWMYL